MGRRGRRVVEIERSYGGELGFDSVGGDALTACIGHCGWWMVMELIALHEAALKKRTRIPFLYDTSAGFSDRGNCCFL